MYSDFILNIFDFHNCINNFEAQQVCYRFFFDIVNSFFSNSCTKNLSIDETDGSEAKGERESRTSTWEVLSKQDHLSVMRRQMESGLYEYKGMINNIDVLVC